MSDKILIVDDDKDIRNLISVYLENEGLQTQKAEDAIEALKLLEEKEFDLIL
ncbi:response regulator, partial [Bacillus toyonensis]|uniref:response regulator n=2 Tax=Bacillaceae TaxID=186817 RepID=UPI000C01D81B